MSGQAEIWMSGREPELAEVMSDPIVHLIMRRDGLSEGDVWAAVRLGQARLHGGVGGVFRPRQQLRKSA